MTPGRASTALAAFRSALGGLDARASPAERLDELGRRSARRTCAYPPSRRWPLAVEQRQGLVLGGSRVSHGLMTAWPADGRGPQLVSVAMNQAGVDVDSATWKAVGMVGSSSIHVAFSGAIGHPVGAVGDYLARPGVWQGVACIGACWYGGARALGVALHRAVVQSPATARDALGLAALGKVDMTLFGGTARGLRLVGWRGSLFALDTGRWVWPV